jgi:hypothetical protein
MRRRPGIQCFWGGDVHAHILAKLGQKYEPIWSYKNHSACVIEDLFAKDIAGRDFWYNYFWPGGSEVP